jgi:crotonobetainyl-CoA:carnitine CoA-transferase CaiB-like acyl-CoA transferase
MLGPLTGIRLLEWAAWINGPSVGALLGDLGAGMVKMEDPKLGESKRRNCSF